MEQELKIEIIGRVQGVNFRRSIENFAKSLYLKGYVKNLTDGSVFVLAQGTQERLEELLSWCQKGTFLTKIRSMFYEWRNPEHKFKNFKIIKDKSFIQDQLQSFINLGKEVFKYDKINNVPNHVVIIPDGNRRWAREKGWKAYIGHKFGGDFQRLLEIFEQCKNLGIRYLTFWAMSTENWDRDPLELKLIFNLLEGILQKSEKVFQENEMRFRHFGRLDRLPKRLVAKIEEIEEKTAKYSKLYLQLCLDYGGRDEIVRAVNKMLQSGIKKINEKTFQNYLDSAGLPDPDLIIRTSGEKRTSGIMPFQGVYAELYFTNVYFPDFDAEQFYLAVLDYSKRTRRFGGTAEIDLKNVNVHELAVPKSQ